MWGKDDVGENARRRFSDQGCAARRYINGENKPAAPWGWARCTGGLFMLCAASWPPQISGVADSRGRSRPAREYLPALLISSCGGSFSDVFYACG